jgi:hypothetical protein
MAVFRSVVEELLLDGCPGLESTACHPRRLKAFGTRGDIMLDEA